MARWRSVPKEAGILHHVSLYIKLIFQKYLPRVCPRASDY